MSIVLSPSLLQAELFFGTLTDQLVVGVSVLVLKVFVGALMIVHGAPKLSGPARSQMRDGFKQLGVPGPLFDLVGILELLGGLFLILGLLTRLVALLFALEMVGNIALYLTKLYKAPIPRGWVEPFFKATKGYVGGWELDTLILASSVALVLVGPGLLSIDQLILQALL